MLGELRKLPTFHCVHLCFKELDKAIMTSSIKVSVRHLPPDTS